METQSRLKPFTDVILFSLVTAGLLTNVHALFAATETPSLESVIAKTPAEQKSVITGESRKDEAVDMHTTLSRLFMMEKEDLKYVVVEDDLNFDENNELIAFTQHSYHMTDGRVTVVRVLNILEKAGNDLTVKVKLRLKGMPVPNPTIRTETLLPDKEKVIVLQSHASEVPKTKVQVFRYVESQRLVQVVFHQHGKKLIQLRGKLGIQTDENSVVAKLNYGERLLDRDYFDWDGKNFIFRKEQEASAPDQVLSLIESLQDKLEHEVLAIEIYGDDKVLVYEQSSHNGYYHLFRFDREYKLEEVKPIEAEAIPLEHDSFLYFKKYDGLDESKSENYLQRKGKFYYSPNSVIDNNYQ